MTKRHRRTKAEMIAYRAQKAEEKNAKYLARVEKKMDSKNVSSHMNFISVDDLRAQYENDSKKYDIVVYYGTYTECEQFINSNKNNVIGTKPALEFGETYRVPYYKEI